MATNYSQQFKDAQDQNYINRVQQAILNASIQIANEGSGVTNHVNRASLAQKVLLAPLSYAPLFGQAVASDGTVPPLTCTDAQIDTRVAAIWNDFAGGI